MPTFRYPAVLWQDAGGAWTAIPVEPFDEAAIGFGSTERSARDQLRDYLNWRGKRDGLPASDFHEPRLLTFTVPLRGEHETDGRIYPCPYVVPLKVHCVAGRQESGLLLAALPLSGIHFYYHSPDLLPQLVARYVQQKLEGRSPAALAARLPPPVVKLDEVVARVPRKERQGPPERPPEPLALVAEPLGERSLRKQFSAAWQREADAESLAKTLHDEAANILLVGDPGVGKTTLLADAVRKAERRMSEEYRRDTGRPPKWPHRFWLTNAARLIAGMKYLGQWEERCEEVVAQLAEVGGVLCVERLLDLLRSGGFDSTDSVMAFLMPYLHRGELRMVAEATPAELDACRRLLPGVVEMFRVVPVAPFDRARALALLDTLGGTLAQTYRATAAPDLSARVYELFRRFAPYQAFPGRSVAFVRTLFEQMARAAEPATIGGPPTVTAPDAVTLFRRQTGLPDLFLRDDVPLDAESVRAFFHRQIVAQDEAVDAATRLVVTFKAGLNDPNRPVGVLLFCGPTGVGKTETAKALAQFFFGGDVAEEDLSPQPPPRSGEGEEDEGSLVGNPSRAKSDSPSPLRGGGWGERSSRLVRLDMSEYAGPDAADRFLGPANEPSAFVRAVRAQPFCVVLLDEIEKASPEVFDLLLGICDEGRLTDRLGRVTSFRSAVIVLTSNLGAGRSGGFGFGTAPPTHFSQAVRDYFRPEFFNRLDAVVSFQPLGPAAIETITRGELARLAGREGLAGVRLTCTDAVVTALARAGFDERYGARPLQRAIEARLVAPLARFLLAHVPPEGAVITADLEGEGVVFRL